MINNRLILITVLVVFLLLACQSLSLRGEEVNRIEDGFYAIDSKNILSDIEQGETNVFKLVSFTPEPPLTVPYDKVQWTDDEYFQIARALHFYVWNEDIGLRISYSTYSRARCTLKCPGI